MNELYQFSKQDLRLVSQIKQHQNISAIFYHFWINLVNPNEKFVFVDTIEIVFDKTTTYFLKLMKKIMVIQFLQTTILRKNKKC